MNWRDARSWAASLEWGDAPAWAAFVLAAIALWISIRAQKDGRRSANASETSAIAAQESVDEARLSRIASERSATVAEQQLADQRHEAAERRAAEEEASRPRADFVIERRSAHIFYLRNKGTGPATGVSLSAREVPYVFEPPSSVDLGRHDAVEFRMAGASGRPVPATLYLTWDGQSEEVAVAVPPP
ncbi:MULTISPECIES: hypothetical protein [Streptomyces]|uniref:hypothetical protein n=1 Tax=Streptomyces TaxID=1883 RepID=UPI001F528975|nr:MULTISPECIES: hypothetical protein [unclassified Streptomyces]WST53930.1 hypothetical protein OG475_14135 [Streptomyces rubiginosohelvolus]